MPAKIIGTKPRKATPQMKPVLIENARIIFRNFSGKIGAFNPEGKRNFCVLLNQEDADQLLAEGWKVKYLKPKDPGDEKQPYIQVSVSFKVFPPKIVMIASRGQVVISENTVTILDWAEMSNVDLAIRPYPWEVNGNSGIKAYLKTMYVTIVEDELELKYSNAPDAASTILLEDGD